MTETRFSHKHFFCQISTALQSKNTQMNLFYANDETYIQTESERHAKSKFYSDILFVYCYNID